MTKNLALGDQARDKRDFSEAEKHYREHLRINPSDAPIWVQLGHMMKEQYGPASAIESYRRATVLDSNSADAYLQLAHALKQAGNEAEAILAFQHTFELNPTGEVMRELRHLGIDVELPETQEPMIYMLISDLFDYLRNHPTLSGIQRVQAGIVMDSINSKSQNVAFITVDHDNVNEKGFLLVNNLRLENLLNYLKREYVDHTKIHLLLDECTINAWPIILKKIDTVFIIGAFWNHPNVIKYLSGVKSSGTKVSVYIFDIIPISHPEYAESQLARNFSMALSEIFFIVDYIFTISEFVAHELRNVLKQEGIHNIPVKAIPLAHSLNITKSNFGQWPDVLKNIEGEEYVLYVSTIEGRKNHLYLIQAWKSLIGRGIKVPKIVFVGRMGWRIAGLVEILDATDNLGGRIHIAHDISDAELNVLYQNCLFTVFTSFVEGWGLPVGESLVHGKLCVASSTSSMPEVGGEFVEYIDPYNLTEGIKVFERLIKDREYLKSRQKRIEEQFIPRTWSNVTEDLMKEIAKFSRADTRVYVGAQIRAGEIINTRLLNKSNFSDYMAFPIRILLGSCYQPEGWGTWFKGKNGTLQFLTDCDPGTKVFVYIRIGLAHHITSGDLSVTSDEQKKSLLRSGTVTISVKHIREFPVVRVLSIIDAHGRCTIKFTLDKVSNLKENDTDTLFGLVKFAYAPVDNLNMRMDVNEEMIYRMTEA